uniref:Putative ovule protein n=1 Tax=Solanum chacoense TaxID=4108 RepID=A0A0V0H411_SOLCH
MESQNKYMNQRRGPKHKKSRGEKSVEQNNSTSSSSLWVVVAYSFILRKAKAFYEWICSNGNYDEEQILVTEVQVLCSFWRNELFCRYCKPTKEEANEVSNQN